MAEPAIKHMSLAEFLRWDDGTDTRWELVEGVPVAMAPPAVAHGVVAMRLGARIEAALRLRWPCFVQSEAGIAVSDRADTCYIADLAVSCAPLQRGQQLLADPLLIVEVLSPGTISVDRQEKIPAYRQLPSVQEIVAIDSIRVFAEVVRREGDRWITEIVQGREATLTLASIGLAVPMTALYEGLDVAEGPRSRPAAG